MSNYRGGRPLPEDVHTFRVVDRWAPAPVDAGEEAPPVHLRRAQPIEVLLPRTARWLSDIPERFRPVTLAAQFPRVANLLCASWSDVNTRGDYLDELLHSGRPRRRGFASVVQRELKTLRAVHGTLRDLNRSLWTAPGSDRQG